jgi:ADP-ribose pyrophosphatase YjhB (NUDIX family)
MDLEPQKFFIGVIDFFSVILPGTLLTYVIKDAAGPTLFGDRYPQLTGTEGWAVFLISSYLLGHFIFLLGSWLLDDLVYDPLRNATYKGQIKRLAEGGKLSAICWRWLALPLIKDAADPAVRQAVKIKEHYLDSSKASSAINAFQWCKARLTFDHEAAIARVERFEADSKFFRSLVVLLLVLIPWAAARDWRVLLPGVVFLLILALWRYVDQRVKATNQAYWYIITLDSQRADGYRYKSQSGPSHAGGVVTRKECDVFKYLLVQASQSPHEWVLPKGHIEAGEAMRETAVREVVEETGVWASVRSDLKRVSFSADGESVDVQFYLMNALEERRRKEPRQHAWLTIDNALAQASHPETLDLLRLAQEMQIKMDVTERALHSGR